MRIWNQTVAEIGRRLDFAQYEFLNCPLTDSYLTILLELFRARQEEIQLEVPLIGLFESVSGELTELSTDESFDTMAFRRQLNQLKDWKNITLRLAPTRIRRIEDRALDRYLVRLTDSTNQVLLQLEQQLLSAVDDDDTSVRFSLSDVEEFLDKVISAIRSDELAQPELYKVARILAQTRQAVEDAGKELMRLDLWLSEIAIRKPDRNELSDLLHSLSNYFDRYLGEVEQQRRRCNEKLECLFTDDTKSFFSSVHQAWISEIADDPSRQNVHPPSPEEIMATVQDFLKPDGVLEHRRQAVHQRLADVTGHLKRVLAEIVRRSQLMSSLRELSSQLLHSPDQDSSNGIVDELFLNLWQPAHFVSDEGMGTPNRQFIPSRPYSNYVRTNQRFSGATVRPKSTSKAAARPAMIEQMDRLNAFVDRVVLDGQKEVHTSEIALANWNDVQMLMTAMRFARSDRSHLRRRLRFRIAIVDNPKGKTISIATEDGSGELTVPQMIFTKTR